MQTKTCHFPARGSEASQSVFNSAGILLSERCANAGNLQDDGEASKGVSEDDTSGQKKPNTKEDTPA